MRKSVKNGTFRKILPHMLNILGKFGENSIYLDKSDVSVCLLVRERSEATATCPLVRNCTNRCSSAHAHSFGRCWRRLPAATLVCEFQKERGFDGLRFEVMDKYFRQKFAAHSLGILRGRVRLCKLENRESDSSFHFARASVTAMPEPYPLGEGVAARPPHSYGRDSLKSLRPSRFARLWRSLAKEKTSPS